MKETLLDIKFSKNEFDKKKVILIKHLLQHSIPIKLRKKIVNNLFDRAKSKIKQKALENFYITKKNLLEMSQNGMHFGSHGHYHLKFDKISLKNLKKEISYSLKKFETYGFNNIETVCYPYGNYNQNTIQLLKQFKIKYGFTTKPGSIKFNSKISNFEIPRYDTNDFKNII